MFKTEPHHHLLQFWNFVVLSFKNSWMFGLALIVGIFLELEARRGGKNQIWSLGVGLGIGSTESSIQNILREFPSLVHTLGVCVNGYE